MNNYAVILTHNRPELLAQTVAHIGPSVDTVIVIDNASDPPILPEMDMFAAGNVMLVPIADQPPNLALLWQIGLDIAEKLRANGPAPDQPSRIAFLCDDAPPPEGWFNAVTSGMAQTGAAIGCSGGNRLWVKTEPDHDIAGRMPGWAFVLDPDSGVRPDQSMWWWWCDTDMDFQARGKGGMVTVPFPGVHNVHPGEFTASRSWAGERIHHDSMAFDAKWGFRPW